VANIQRGRWDTRSTINKRSSTCY